MTQVFPKSALEKLSSQLQSIYDQNEAEAIAKIALEHLFEWNTTSYIINRSTTIDSDKLKDLNDYENRLLKHEPIQYIIGESDFYGRKFKVNQEVLIPRQETESLIQLIKETQPWNQVTLADVGTGSGCIPCTLYHEIDTAQVLAFDISKGALEVAQSNASRLNCKIEFRQLNILIESLPLDYFDIIVSNPPYVLDSEKEAMHSNVLEFEPHLALFVEDKHPLLFYEVIAQKAKNSLKKQGYLFFEINEQYGKATADLLTELGYQHVTIHQDLNQKDRFASAQLI
ncbi:peptide chain release factor N(5)-glutamine methyltransferase [Reichenbachiella ulvae]|uniref:peptide chain release factor N(5)-glutamine methyltransferase n=1 Tax=Reichenbachiella ulvae TaxID=2980104 RepID=A0ABT3CZV1_9BACT|nr:peptide chain release factor N(5)-glutamine methyltransferase [Reichenbachiella ulvae]MCV9389210.1 peptide chain release factor N(5)-glutamine methyltransferase [Reichenbachiella ulvae]